MEGAVYKNKNQKKKSYYEFLLVGSNCVVGAVDFIEENHMNILTKTVPFLFLFLRFADTVFWNVLPFSVNWGHHYIKFTS